MSLELALQQNTAAINALVEILAKGLPAAQPATAEGSEAPVKPKKAKPVEAAPSVEEAKTVEETKIVEERVAETVAAVEAAAAEPVTYDDCKKLIVAIAKTDRAKAVALLAQFGAANLQQIKPERFAEVKAAAEKVLQS